MNKIALTISLLVALLFTSTAWGATYYVKIGGNDGLDGLSDANAWASLSKVSSVAFSAGSTIIFSAGTYSGSLKPGASGTSASPITFQTESSSVTVTIDATAQNYGIDTTGRSYLVFDGFTVQNSLNRNTFVTSSTGIQLKNIRSSTATNEGFFVSSATATLMGCSSTLSGLSGYKTYNGATVDYYGCTSTADKTGFTSAGTSTVSHHVCSAQQTTNTTGSGTGFIGRDTSNTTCYACETHGNFLDGMSTSNGAAFSCYYCRSYNNVNLGDGYTAHDTSIFNVVYSLAWGNGKSGAAMTGASSGVILNSTFYNNYSPSYPTTSYGIWLDSSGTWTVQNNITQGHLYEMYVSAMAVTSGIKVSSDYNLFYDSRGGNAFHWNGINYNFAGYKTASGKDAHSLNADPKMVDPENANFFLLSSSPAIDAGVDVGLTSDYAGISVPMFTGVDIGAHEYSQACSGKIGDSPCHGTVGARRSKIH